MLFPEADVEPAPSMKSAIESFSLKLRVKIYEKLSTGHGGVRMQDKILISGFDPFGGEPVNPACELLRILDGKLLDGYRIVTQEIPTARFSRGRDALLGHNARGSRYDFGPWPVGRMFEALRRAGGYQC